MPVIVELTNLQHSKNISGYFGILETVQTCQLPGCKVLSQTTIFLGGGQLQTPRKSRWCNLFPEVEQQPRRI